MSVFIQCRKHVGCVDGVNNIFTTSCVDVIYGNTKKLPVDQSLWLGLVIMLSILAFC